MTSLNTNWNWQSESLCLLFTISNVHTHTRTQFEFYQWSTFRTRTVYSDNFKINLTSSRLVWTDAGCHLKCISFDYRELYESIIWVKLFVFVFINTNPDNSLPNESIECLSLNLFEDQALNKFHIVLIQFWKKKKHAKTERKIARFINGNETGIL